MRSECKSIILSLHVITQTRKVFSGQLVITARHGLKFHHSVTSETFIGDVKVEKGFFGKWDQRGNQFLLNKAHF